MLATHVDPYDLVIACTGPSTLQSAASASYPKLATEQTAAQWEQTLTTPTTQQQTEHTNHSAMEAVEWLVCFYFYLNRKFEIKNHSITVITTSLWKYNNRQRSDRNR